MLTEYSLITIMNGMALELGLQLMDKQLWRVREHAQMLGGIRNVVNLATTKINAEILELTT